MIDLHCHLLAGIDDGPDTLEQSLELARIAVADGVSHAILTPHIHPGRWDNQAEQISRCRDELSTALAANGIALQLGYAAEVRLGEHLLQAVAEDSIPFYGALDGQRVMLLEFPHGHVLPGSEELVSWLRARDIRPLIAHPERNREIMRQPDRILPFLQQGCLLQVTGGSVLGNFGAGAELAAHYFLEQDMVFALASDGHNNGARQPVLAEAHAWVEQRLGAARAHALTFGNPATLVAGQFPGLG